MINITCAFDVLNDTPVEGGIAYNQMESDIAEPVRRLIKSGYGINGRLIGINLKPNQTSEIPLSEILNNSIEVSDDLKKAFDEASTSSGKTIPDDKINDFLRDYVDIENLGLCTAIYENESDDKVQVRTAIGQIYPRFIVQQVTFEMIDGKRKPRYQYYVPIYIGPLGVALYGIDIIPLKYDFLMLRGHPGYILKGSQYTTHLSHTLMTAKMCGIANHQKVGLPHTMTDAIGMIKYLMLNDSFNPGYFGSGEKVIIYEINTNLIDVEPYPPYYCNILDAIDEISADVVYAIIDRPNHSPEYYASEDEADTKFKEFSKKVDQWYSQTISYLADFEPENPDILSLYSDILKQDAIPNSVPSKHSRKIRFSLPFMRNKK